MRDAASHIIHTAVIDWSLPTLPWPEDNYTTNYHTVIKRSRETATPLVRPEKMALQPAGCLQNVFKKVELKGAMM